MVSINYSNYITVMFLVFPFLQLSTAGGRRAWCIFSRVVWMTGGGVTGRGLGAELGTVVFKACPSFVPPLRSRACWRSSHTLFFLLFFFSWLHPPVSLPLETCPRITTQPSTPQRWGLDAPLLCWHQEETPKVSMKMSLCSFISALYRLV